MRLSQKFQSFSGGGSRRYVPVCGAPRGLLIAQKTGLRVYLGHEMETLNYSSKSQLVSNFYQGRAESDWLTATPVTWVLYGPYEQDSSNGSHATFPGLEVVYQSEGITIYRVMVKHIPYEAGAAMIDIEVEYAGYLPDTYRDEVAKFCLLVGARWDSACRFMSMPVEISCSGPT